MIAKPPSRFTFESFSRFIPIVKMLVHTYPAPLVFTAQGLSPETVVCRMRDGLKEYFRQDDWEIPGVDKNVMKSIVENVTFSHDGVKVRIGKGDKKARRLEEVNQEKSQAQGLTVKNPPPEVFQALLTLHSYEILRLPTEISESTLPQSYLDMAEATPNIDLSSDGKRYILI